MKLKRLKSLLIISLLTFNSNAYASSCEFAYQSPINEAEKLWLQCEIDVLKNQSPKDQYLLAQGKSFTFTSRNNKWVYTIKTQEVPKDLIQLEHQTFKEILNLISKSSDGGYLEAQFCLGSYFSGQRAGPFNMYPSAFFRLHNKKDLDYKKAFKLLQKAASRGHSEAQRELATLYLSGKGVDTNILKALSLLSDSARQENTSAALDLARIYLTLKKDKIGYAWYLYYERLRMQDPYSVERSNYDLLKLEVAFQGRKLPDQIPPDIEKKAKTLLIELSNGEFNGFGIPNSLTK